MRKILVALGAIALCTWAAFAIAAGSDELLKQAQGAEKKGDYDSAKQFYQQAADQGDAEAAHRLGELYYNLAAARGLADTTGGHQEDVQVAEDISQAATWLGKAADQGNTEAQASLATLYETDRYGMKDAAKAYRWRLTAAQGGDRGSQYVVGVDLEKGEGVQADAGAAIGWYQKAAAQGDAGAKDALLRLTPPGEDPVKQALHDGLVADWNGNVEGAIKAYRRAAALGSAEGQGRLGEDLMSYISLAVAYNGMNNQDYKPPAADCKEMLDNLQKAGAQKYSDALYNLGLAYENGLCVKGDQAKARDWYRKAAKLGNKNAEKALAQKN
ncbi:MAG: hypothetical protein ACM3ZT_06385 [Bacillota bacterium]